MALSPALFELAVHLRDRPESRYVLIFPLLLTLVARRGGWAAAPPARDGLWWVALAVGFELLMLAGGVGRAARAAIPLALIGFWRHTGAVALPVALLSLWFVPAPNALSTRFDQTVENVVRQALEPLPASLGFEPGAAADPAAWHAVRSHAAGGATLAACLAGLGWYASVRSAAAFRPGAAVLRAGLWALWALPLRIAVVTGLAALLWLGRPAWVPALSPALWWIPVSALGVLLVERRARMS